MEQAVVLLGSTMPQRGTTTAILTQAATAMQTRAHVGSGIIALQLVNESARLNSFVDTPLPITTRLHAT